mmetsp:Transcript_6053/g.17499  ORF Transcript_6053/g.17499 Transcript_6053/m.17499 type:complete len:83 (+) Transcript_6053:447-695(+)
MPGVERMEFNPLRSALRSACLAPPPEKSEAVLGRSSDEDGRLWVGSPELLWEANRCLVLLWEANRCFLTLLSFGLTEPCKPP